VGTSCQNGITNRDKFLNQIRFCISYFATGAKGKYITGGTGLFEITCRGATSFAELDQARKLVTTVVQNKLVNT